MPPDPPSQRSPVGSLFVRPAFLLEADEGRHIIESKKTYGDRMDVGIPHMKADEPECEQPRRTTVSSPREEHMFDRYRDFRVTDFTGVRDRTTEPSSRAET